MVKRNILFAFVAVVTSICSGQWLERQVVIGDTFGGVNVPEGGRVVVNPISGSVYIESSPIQVFDPVTMQKTRGPGRAGLVVFCPPSGKGFVIRDSAVVIDAAADTVLGVTALPFGPSSVAYSRTSNRLYLGSTFSETLFVFDPDGDSVLSTVGIGADVTALLWDSAWNRLYVGTESDSLSVIDCTADTVLTEVEVGLGYVWTMTLSTASRKLYCTREATDSVVIVSTDSLKAIGALQGVTDVYAMVYSPAADRMYISQADDSLFIVDCPTDSVRARLEGPYPLLVVCDLSGRAYVARSDSALLLVTDTTDLIVGRIPLPAVPTHSVAALGFWPGRNELYGVTYPGDLAFRIDASSDTVTGTVNYAQYSPRQMVHNPAGNKLYLLCPGHDEVLVMDSTFGTPKRLLRGATDNDAQPVLNPTLNRLYVADYHSLRVIDCNTDSLLGSKAMPNVSQPRPVMVPYLNKLYVFDDVGSGDTVYAYDCLRDTLIPLFEQDDDVTCAVYDPRSNRIFFACEDAPTIRTLDPVTNSVVKTFDLLGGSYNGRMALDPDLGRLYYTDQSPEMMFTIDVLGDSVISSESLPWDVDGMFLNRRLGKLFMCSRDTSQALVFDCAQGTIVDTFDVGHTFTTGLMDDRNDKLYLGYGVVIDCRYDSVVTHLDSFSPSSVAWDAIDNRVFQATTSRLYVYRDDPYGIEEQMVGVPAKRHATIVRGVLFMPRDMTELPGNSDRVPRPILLDISGRKVVDLKPGANDVRSLSPGVYFVRSEPSAVSRGPSAVTKVVVTR